MLFSTWPHTSHLQQCLYPPTTIAKSNVTDILKQHVLVNMDDHHISCIIITVAFLMGPIPFLPCHPQLLWWLLGRVIVSFCRRWGLQGPGGRWLLSESLAPFCLPVLDAENLAQFCPPCHYRHWANSSHFGYPVIALCVSAQLSSWSILMVII